MDVRPVAADRILANGRRDFRTAAASQDAQRYANDEKDHGAYQKQRRPIALRNPRGPVAWNEIGGGKHRRLDGGTDRGPREEIAPVSQRASRSSRAGGHRLAPEGRHAQSSPGRAGAGIGDRLIWS